MVVDAAWLLRRQGKLGSSLITTDQPCQRCGYNLRGLKIPGVCPECGAPIRGRSTRVAGGLLTLPIAKLRSLSAWFALAASVALASVVTHVALTAYLGLGQPPSDLGSRIGAAALMAFAGVYAIGVWRTSAPLALPPREDLPRLFRGRQVRLLAAGLAWGWAVSAALMIVAGLDPAWQPLALAGTHAAWIAGFAAMGCHAGVGAVLALEANDDDLFRRCGYVLFGAPIFGPLALLGPLAAQAGGVWAFLGYVGYAGWLFLVCVVLVYLRNLGALARLLSWAADNVQTGLQRDERLRAKAAAAAAGAGRRA